MTEFKGDKRTKEYKEWKANQSKGVGDTIAKVTKATGIDKAVKFLLGDDCGCDDRKDKLNKLFPYKVECLNESEYNYLKTFFKDMKGTVNVEQQNKLLKINNRVFNDNRKGSSCGSCVREMVNNLKSLYNDYNK
mgnify:FL=1